MPDPNNPSKKPAGRMPEIVAHRGASGDAPENTLAAIRMAADHGATWIEIDVNISRDAVPVLFHDDGLSRCSNGDGLVIEHTLQSLQSLDTGTWFSENFAGERIATLDDCLALALELNLGINLEIKPCSGWEIPTTGAIAKLLNSKSTLPPVVVSSFSHIAMQQAATLLPEIPRSCLYLVAPPDWQSLTSEVGASNIHLHANSLLTKAMTDEYKAQGLGVYCYTVNTVEDARKVFDAGVDGIFTNYPKALLKVYG